MNLKNYAWIIMLVCICLIMSACNNNKEESQEEIKLEKATFAFEADNGSVEVPKDPKKVVVLSSTYVGYLLQLGVKPVAVPKLAFDNPYFKGMLEGTEVVTSDAIDEIMMLEPDLIITETTDKNIPLLQDIAPTVAFDWIKRDYLEKMTVLGQLVGKEKEAEAWLTKWEEKVAINKELVQKVMRDKTISIIESSSEGVRVYGNQAGHGGEVIYDALELRAPDLVQQNIINQVAVLKVPLESVPQYAGDYIYYSNHAEGDYQVQNSSVWMNLPAVKNNRVLPLDERTSYLSDPITLDKVMDKVVKDLTQKSF
ncbi:ABC transporter substrate-binding protein [Bacillus sp. JJ722]|uniref:ABC transporter substrate-binding protein n=1 Tax=Bacillus sp. JJ722 TaxID=3122973 RepID=UPI002FFE5430